MPLSLLRSSAPPEPPAPLSPARQALAETIAQIAETERQLGALNQPRLKADAAADALAIAQAVVDQIAEAEAAALRAWTANPAGALPAPLSERRALALADLADATREHHAAQQAAQATEATVVRAHERLCQLLAQRSQQIDAVVLDEAREHARALQRLRVEMARHEGMLVSAREYFQRRPPAALIARWLDLGNAEETDVPGPEVLRRHVAAQGDDLARRGKVATANLRAFSALPVALANDASATVNLVEPDDEREPAPGSAA